MQLSKLCIILIVSALCAADLAAQRGGAGSFGNSGGFGGTGGRFGGGGFGSGGSNRGSGTLRVTRDTSDIFYFFPDEPNVVYAFGDSLLGALHQYDPIRQQAFDHAHLGNLGSAARPLIFQPTWRRGFDLGLHQFDLYQMSSADVRHYKITQSYTHAGFSQGNTQADALFNVRFSTNFANGINLSIEHRRINNLGAYDNQSAFTSAFASSLWFHPKKGNYDGFLTYVSNAVEQQDNGGATEDLTVEILPAFEVDVALSTANTRHANQELAYTQYFYLSGGRRTAGGKGPTPQDSTSTLPPGRATTDSLNIPAKQPPAVSRPTVATAPQPASRTFTFIHKTSWKSGTYKFYDSEPDSAYYGDFLVDRRGLRHFTKARKLENTVKLQTFKLKPQAPGQAPPSERDLLEVGIVHSLNWVDMEPVDTGVIQNLFLTGQLKLAPGERLQFGSYAHLGIGDNAGDFRLSGELTISLKSLGTLRLEAVNQLYSPSLLHQRYYLTQRELWKQSFGKTLETSLSGTYLLPKLHLSLGAQNHLLNNLVYFGEDGLPRQSGTFNIVQFILQKDFQLGPFHLDNQFTLQQATSDVLALPPWYGRHSLYFEGKIFKKVMLTRLGVDARLIGPHTPPSYSPTTGQFHLQSGQALPFTPLLDAHLSFKVKTFRFFFKVENLLTYPLQTYYFQTAGSPLPFGFQNGGMRMGISWRLVD